MNQQNSQPEKPKEKRRFSQEQYDMLKRCSDKKDMAEWNEWRKKHSEEDILLDGRVFKGWWLERVNFTGEIVWNYSDGKEINFTSEVHLEGANFDSAHLQQAIFTNAHLEETCFEHADVKTSDFHYAHLDNAELGVAHFENCDFTDAILVNASLTPSELSGAKFTNTDLRGCSIRACVVNGSTRFWNCHINRYSKSKRFTDLTGTALNNVIIIPGEKQLFEYNIRRQNWEEWYKIEKKDELPWWESRVRDKKEIGKLRSALRYILTLPVRLFWLISDYGISTKRIIFTFFGLAFVFALLYRLFPDFVMVYGHVGDIRSFWHALYFSVVTMTTLGFGDIAANPDSWIGQTLQVILGYVLLGALVTRFAVLFTAGGPAGKFADEKVKGKKAKMKKNKSLED